MKILMIIVGALDMLYFVQSPANGSTNPYVVQSKTFCIQRGIIPRISATWGLPFRSSQGTNILTDILLLLQSRAHSMHGCMDLFSKIYKNVRNWESLHPYMTIFRILGFLKIRTWDFCKSLHFTGIILLRAFFFLFFIFTNFFKFSCFAQIYKIYSTHDE